MGVVICQAKGPYEDSSPIRNPSILTFCGLIWSILSYTCCFIRVRSWPWADENFLFLLCPVIWLTLLCARLCARLGAWLVGALPLACLLCGTWIIKIQFKMTILSIKSSELYSPDNWSTLLKLTLKFTSCNDKIPEYCYVVFFTDCSH